MKELIETIIHFLRTHNRPVVKLLQQGLNRKDIEKIVGATKLKFPEEFFQLYSLCNGTLVRESDYLDDLHFFPGFYLLSLEDAIYEYAFLMKTGNWNKNWFPIFANGGGDYFCIECKNGDECPIVIHMVGILDDELIQYSNLHSMFKTIAECFKENAYYLDIDNDYLESDIDMERTIGLKNNPGLKRWQ